jgi:hypothetical protein
MSIFQSAIRLNAIAAVLAPIKHTSTPNRTLPVGTPPAANNIAANPKGMAKIVWDILINSPHRLIAENIYTAYHNSTHRLKPQPSKPRAHHLGAPIELLSHSNLGRAALSENACVEF